MTDTQHNVGDMKRKIRAAIQAVKQLKLDREDTNAEISAVRENMNALGIPKAAFDMALKYLNWDEDKRQGFDVAYALVREAGGAPMQEDLFQAADRMAADNASKGEGDPPQSDQKTADANAIDKIFRAEDAEKTKGKRVLETSGAQQGAQN